MPSEPHRETQESARALRLAEEPMVHFDEGRTALSTWNCSAAALFTADTAMRLEAAEGRYERLLCSPREVAAAVAWQAYRFQHVYLSDDLDSSIALDDLFRGEHGSYTPIGRLESFAKGAQDPQARNTLAALLSQFIRSSPLYAGCAICAVPASSEKCFDLPRELAALVAGELRTEDLTRRLRLRGKKQPLKTLALGDKLPALEAARLTVETLIPQPVILIDDKYQSGTTANWIGAGLRAAGATAVHGVFLVKTWRGKDNLIAPGDQPD